MTVGGIKYRVLITEGWNEEIAEPQDQANRAPALDPALDAALDSALRTLYSIQPSHLSISLTLPSMASVQIW
jgi:hypothetical protein